MWSEDKLNKKFVVVENFAELVSAAALTCLDGGGFDPLWSSNGWGIWPSNWQHSGEFDQNFSKNSNAPGFARGGMGGFGIDRYIIQSDRPTQVVERCTPGFSSLSIFVSFPLTYNYISTIFHHFLSLQEYPLDDLCNEVIERWKTSRANVLQEKELVKGKNCVTS